MTLLCSAPHKSLRAAESNSSSPQSFTHNHRHTQTHTHTHTHTLWWRQTTWRTTRLQSRARTNKMSKSSLLLIWACLSPTCSPSSRVALSRGLFARSMASMHHQFPRHASPLHLGHPSLVETARRELLAPAAALGNHHCAPTLEKPSSRAVHLPRSLCRPRHRMC